MKTKLWFKRSILFYALLFLAGTTQFLDAQVTKPEEYLGFKPGADFHLANYEQAIGYFEKIAAQTDRMRVFDMGPTSYGRRMKFAIISSGENMARLEHYKEINARLSLVRGVSEEEAEKLAEEGRVVVWIDCGLHATETSPAQHAIQLAYDMVTAEDRRTRLIRENVILLLVFANPDGLTMVSDWYKKNLGTPYEVSRPPFLYQKYAGHDNNRDSFIANLQEVQNMNRITCHEWFPEILYNQHETAPFPARIWIPPESEPMNPNVHPIIVRWKNLIGAAMGKAFEEAGQPGAISRIYFDSWYPGYVTQFVGGHNIPSILTETANYGYATPRYYTLYDFPAKNRDLTKGVFYPTPWRGGWWRLSDAVAYNLTASKSILEVAAKFRYEFLYNKWRMGRDVIERFKKEPPYGWIIPLEQTDNHTTALMLNRFILNGVEVYRADEGFEHDGIYYPKGSYIIPTSQPFGLFVKNIMEKQKYPDLKKYPHLWQGIVGSAKLAREPLRSYDCVGWTLPIQMGVEYREMSRPLDIKMTRVDTVVLSKGRIKGGGPYYLLSHSDNGSFIAVNTILERGGRVDVSVEELTLNRKKYPKGTFIIHSKTISRDELARIVNSTGVILQGAKIAVKRKRLRRSRIALYKSWMANMDAGWISYILEKYGFKYHQLRDSEVRAGRLNDRFDVIILPDQWKSSIINGHRKGTMPPDYVGGITRDGVENLKEFVENGGTLICNKSSTDLAIKEFNFPLKNILEKVKPDSFSCPGSILKIIYDNNNPVAFGMKKKGIAFFSYGRVFEVISDTVSEKVKKAEDKNDKKKSEKRKEKPKKRYAEIKYKVVARFPDEPLLISGWILGDSLIRNKAAIMDVEYGNGRVVLFGFNVQNRAQAYYTFKLLFNCLY